MQNAVFILWTSASYAKLIQSFSASYKEKNKDAKNL